VVNPDSRGGGIGGISGCVLAFLWKRVARKNIKADVSYLPSALPERCYWTGRCWLGGFGLIISITSLA